MAGLQRFLHEIHRRSLWQVVGIYLAASWVALQVVETLTESVGLPEWVPGAAIAIFVVGFPLVLGTAFVQDGVTTRPRKAPSAPDEAGAEPMAPAPHRYTTTHGESLASILAERG